MNNRYIICWLQICPFEKLNGGILKPNRDDYPYRLCVLDRVKLVAIDVKLEQSYEYINTSLVYFINEESKKIRDNRRYAIMKLSLYLLPVTSYDYKKAMPILEDLKNGKEYIDGNIISNEEYLECINNENINKVKVKNR